MNTTVDELAARHAALTTRVAELLAEPSDDHPDGMPTGPDTAAELAALLLPAKPKPRSSP